MNSLQNKLKDYEVAPPAFLWENITAVLDESLLDKEFPSRLHNMEVTPPAVAWDHIDSALPGSLTPVIPIKKSTPSFLRYAAAAILIGIVAFGILKWTSSSPSASKEGIVTINPGSDTGISSKSDNVANTQVPSPANPEPAGIENEEEKSVAQFVRSRKADSRKSSGQTLTTASYDYSDQYTNPIYAYQDYVPDLSERYIRYMTPEGNIIRLSKKLENLVCCVSGEDQDADCKNKLKEWQEKIAASPMAASPGNFLDILTLVGSLDDAGTEL